MSVAVSAIVRPSGVSVWVSIDTGPALTM
jgi:hypothetical protein